MSIDILLDFGNKNLDLKVLLINVDKLYFLNNFYKIAINKFAEYL